MHHRHTIADIQNFLHVAADHQNHAAAIRELAHEPVDFRLGSNINSARGFVQDHHLGGHGKPFAKDDFLLISAAQVHDERFAAGGFDLQRSNLLVRHLALAITADEVKRGIFFKRWQGGVLAHRHAGYEPFATPVFRNQINPVPNGIGRRMNGHAIFADGDFRPTRRIQTHDGFDYLRAPCPDQSGEAQDFAAGGVELHRAGRVAAGTGIADLEKTGRFGRR